MKTWEVYKMALENPNLKFRCLTDCLDKGKVFKLSKNGIMVEDIKNGYCLLVPDVNGDWELVREPVPWQEAIQAWLEGKKIEIVLPYGTRVLQKSGRRFGSYLRTYPESGEMNGFPRDAFINGKWYVE